ncbi:hypothetical protein MUK42_07140 [Musa troglodytarum]|uniref:Uncharacterized protein n=3 Tax=Musa troglodytarum TaxID=320322 RepID=A0A9E7KLL2_9LILI|nr:hypothetical protein MUK42_07140 [Musa troglodytarum]
MAPSDDDVHSWPPRPPTRGPMVFRLPHRWAAAPSLRRRKMTVVRLGSRRGWRWRGRGRRLLGGLLRRMRLRWLAAMYRSALNRLRESYGTVVKELIEAQAVQSQLMRESYLAVPFPGNAPYSYHTRS